MNTKSNNIPQHIAIIMDGNRRWAQKRHLPSLAGHKYATDHTVENLIEEAGNLGIKYITFWAWSTENWERGKDEVKGMMKLLLYAIKTKVNRLHQKGARLKVIGDLSQFPHQIEEELQKGIEKTKNNLKITVIFALNYGGRDEIIRAVKKLVSSKYKVASINEKNFSDLLDTSAIPDPDLIVRTGGEKRLSGFLLWQSEYAEIYFTDILFPDFIPNRLKEAINWYQGRNRRFGK